MKEYQPPKLPLKLFRFYCSEERLEELEGDLYEVYQERIKEKGIRFAKLFYWWLIIRSFRSYALKRTKMKNKGHLLSIASLAHNIKIAWRNIVRRKTTTAINVVGLAIGIGGFVAIYSLVSYELSFNKHIPDRDQIYRVYTEFGGAFSGTNRGAPTAVPVYLRENASPIEMLAHFHHFSTEVSVVDDNGDMKDFARNRKIILADSSYFKIIDQYKWLAGSPKNSLSDPKQVVLTKEQGKKYFGNISPLDMIGKRLTYQDSLEVKVSGIVSMIANKTDFLFTDFISFKSTETTWLKDEFTVNDWEGVSSSRQTFIKVSGQTTEVQLDEMLRNLNKEAEAHQKENDTWQTYLKLQPINNLHYGTHIGIFDNTGPATHLKTLRVLMAVAIALLSIAIFNFINLETAQAINKSKEVGLRKAMGISRPSLLGRFLTESTLVTFLAAIVSLPLAFFGIKLFSDFVPNDFTIEWFNPVFWMSLIVLIVLVGFLAGIYPAFIASSYSPVQALKSTLKFSAKSGSSQVIRKVLITSQFIFSKLLVICTIAVVWQISYMLDKEMGFKEEGVIYFNTPFYEKSDKQKIIMNEIDKIPQIAASSLHQSPPAMSGWSFATMKYFDQDSTEIVESVHQRQGDVNYLDVYQLELVAGRNIQETEGKLETIINETCARTFGFEEPQAAIGVQISNGELVYEVVGVLKDFHAQSLHIEIASLMYSYDDEYTKCIGISVATQDLQPVINELTDIWNEIYPKDPLSIKFMDETVESFYETEKRTSKVAGVATVIAILISCLGLFGLISYSIIQKSKEVGIRKVLGASLLNIGTVLSREFFILILISFLIAIPASYYLIDNWMEDFSYKTNISWWIYGLGGFISIAIAFMSIGVKIWKASDANPIDSLRYE